jgi:hypothetical protein
MLQRSTFTAEMSARSTLVQSVLGLAQDLETHTVELLWHVIGLFRHVVGHAKTACFTPALLLLYSCFTPALLLLYSCFTADSACRASFDVSFTGGGRLAGTRLHFARGHPLLRLGKKGGPLKNEKSKADLHVFLGAFYIWSEFTSMLLVRSM